MNVAGRAANFNAAVDNLRISAVDSDADVLISQFAYGRTNRVGICQPAGSEGFSRSFDWDELVYINLNETYMRSYAYRKRSAVIIHEMVHCIAGLHHISETGRIMQRLLSHYYDRDDVWHVDTSTASDIDDFWDE